MFGSGAGYIGSDSGSQLGNFMSTFAHTKRSVVLLDEFDHCNSETWEAFYHIFEEGEYTMKKVNSMDGKSADASQTNVLDCSKTIWLLTTNKFDNDIVAFNENHAKSINEFKKGNYAFSKLNDKFEEYIRPKLRRFFQGGLTRRINSIVPFFAFDEEEAMVICDMYIDLIRSMYSKPPTTERKIGDYAFDVTQFAVGELSRAYFKHQLDGASAIIREVNNQVIKKQLHMRWLREEDLPVGDDPDASIWIHYGKESGGAFVLGALSEEARDEPPYFKKHHVQLETSVGGPSSTTTSILEEFEASEWIDPFRRTSEGEIPPPSPPRRSSRHESSAPASASAEVMVIRSIHKAVNYDKSNVWPTAFETLGGVGAIDAADQRSYSEHEDGFLVRTSTHSTAHMPAEVPEPPDRSSVNISVFFDDASEGIMLSNPMDMSLSASHLLTKICESLALNLSTSRLWMKVRDVVISDSLDRPFSQTVVGLAEDRRAVVKERTDIIGSWMFIRDSSRSIEALLEIRKRVGHIPYDECVSMLVETALCSSKYSTGNRWARDTDLEAWRNELRENDIVDVFVAGDDNIYPEDHWREGRVLKVSREYDGERSVELRVLGLSGVGETFVTKLRCSSDKIQPLYTKSVDWRSQLVVGSTVEVRITQNNWHHAVIEYIDSLTALATVCIEAVDKSAYSRNIHLYSEDIRTAVGLSPSAATEL
jgi:hypothetical protein